jgi:predicted SnoaL-like aldol condensation-catalyzing enzyme
MVALYSDDAIHTSPKLKSAQPAGEGRLVGKAAMRQWWQDAFDRLPSISYEVVTIVSDDHVAVLEYLRHRPGEATIRVAEVFEIKEGKIVRSNVYHG